MSHMITHRGWLQKKGVNSGWKKRWFILENSILYYYVESDLGGKGRNLRGQIAVKDMTAAVATEGNYFQIEIPGRIYQLCAETQHEAIHWLQVLAANKKYIERGLPQQHSSPYPNRVNYPPSPSAKTNKKVIQPFPPDDPKGYPPQGYSPNFRPGPRYY